MLIINSNKKVKNFSTRDYVYEILRENIITLKIEPGKNISEKEISELLEVSRTPVREAFVKLAQEELLEVYPQKGTIIALIDLHHVEESRFIREHLERATVRVACERFSEQHLGQLAENLSQQQVCIKENDFSKLFKLDEEFHKTIAYGSGKERIWNLIQQMNAHLNRIRMLSLAANYDWELILSQHEQIYTAIKAEDAETAEKVMEEHLKKLTFEQEKLRQDYQQYFK